MDPLQIRKKCVDIGFCTYTCHAREWKEGLLKFKEKDLKKKSIIIFAFTDIRIRGYFCYLEYIMPIVLTYEMNMLKLM